MIDENGDIDKKVLHISVIVTTTVLNIKIGEVESKSKMPDACGLVTAAVLNTKNREVENKIPDVS